jgi:hypothetical protein
LLSILFADDTTLYESSSLSLDDLIKGFSKKFYHLFDWIKYNKLYISVGTRAARAVFESPARAGPGRKKARPARAGPCGLARTRKARANRRAFFINRICDFH